MKFAQVENPRGNSITIVGVKWIFAPLPLAAVERFQDELNSGNVPISAIADMSHISLKRNYPEITREYVAEELIDMANMQDVLATITQVSGLEYTGNTEEQTSGE